mgnify:CR=1 FL=1
MPLEHTPCTMQRTTGCPWDAPWGVGRRDAGCPPPLCLLRLYGSTDYGDTNRQATVPDLFEMPSLLAAFPDDL